MGYSSADPRNYLALARQAAEGTEATTGFKFIRYLGSSGYNVSLETESIMEGGGGQDPSLNYLSKVKPDGSIEAYARIDLFTYLSAWALGSGAAIGTSVGIGTSVFVPNATAPNLTVEQAWGGGNQIDRVSNAMITGFTLEAEAGMPWKITAPFIGGATPYYRDGIASALSPVLESGDPAMYHGGAYLLNGATSFDITNFTYTFERRVDDDLFTTNPFRRKVVSLSRRAGVEFQMIWQDQALYKQALYSGGSVVGFNLPTGSFKAQRVLTGSQMIGVDIPLLNIMEVSVNRLEPDGQTVVLNISGEAVKGATGLVQHRSTHDTIGATAYLSP